MTLNFAVAERQAGEHLKLLELCYRYAFLAGRRAAGLSLSAAHDHELELLSHLFEGDPKHRRRLHRRFPLVLHGVVKTPTGLCSAMVLNLSGHGMYVITTREVEPGETVQVKIGRPGEVEYLFTCTVVRSTTRNGVTVGLGLSFCCVPLEMRRRAA